MEKGKISVRYILFVAFVLGLTAAAIAFVSVFTNRFTDEFKTFYVKYGEYIFATKDRITLMAGQEYRFDTGNSLDWDKDGEPTPYTVAVKPNITVSTNFGYTADGESYTYETDDGEDFSSAFNVQVYDRYFTIETPQSMTAALSSLKKHSGKTLTLPELDLAADAYFTISVTTYNGANAIEIDCFLLSDNTPPDGKEDPTGSLAITIDTLGNGSVVSVNAEYPPTANAGDTVTCTLTMIDEALEITAVDLRSTETGDTILRFPNSGEGVYTFTMPNEDVCIMIYLMTV